MFPKNLIGPSIVLLAAAGVAARALPGDAPRDASPALAPVAARHVRTLPVRAASPRRAARPAARDSAAPARSRFFPVAGRGLRDVVGRWGDPRDGGSRPHHGVDIAAPRGTPVVAVGDGTVDRVEHTPVGGLVVWLREGGTGRVHYYAHLDRILVRSGERVRAGEQLGTVGNTGNAATTAPHLHYGLHQDGFLVNPFPLLAALVGGKAPAERLARSGPAAPVTSRWARTRFAGAALKAAPRGGATLRTLARNERVEVLGTSGRLYHVRFDGQDGYIARWLLE